VLPGRAAVLPGGVAARRRRMFHPPANALHAAVAYRTTALNAWRHDRAASGGELVLKFKFVNRQLIENNNVFINKWINKKQHSIPKKIKNVGHRWMANCCVSSVFL
jgi:hypothetical protein